MTEWGNIPQLLKATRESYKLIHVSRGDKSTTSKAKSINWQECIHNPDRHTKLFSSSSQHTQNAILISAKFYRP